MNGSNTIKGYMKNEKLSEWESKVIKELINVLASNEVTFAQVPDLFDKACEGLNIMAKSNRVNQV